MSDSEDFEICSLDVTVEKIHDNFQTTRIDTVCISKKQYESLLASKRKSEGIKYIMDIYDKANRTNLHSISCQTQQFNQQNTYDKKLTDNYFNKKQEIFQNPLLNQLQKMSFAILNLSKTVRQTSLQLNSMSKKYNQLNQQFCIYKSNVQSILKQKESLKSSNNQKNQLLQYYLPNQEEVNQINKYTTNKTDENTQEIQCFIQSSQSNTNKKDTQKYNYWNLNEIIDQMIRQKKLKDFQKQLGDFFKQSSQNQNVNDDKFKKQSNLEEDFQSQKSQEQQEEKQESENYQQSQQESQQRSDVYGQDSWISEQSEEE